MITRHARTLLLATAAIVLTAQAPPPAASPAIDDAGAAAITDAVHAMLTDMLADFAPPPDALHATAQGDHYHIEIPIAHRWDGGSVGGDSAGADLIPLGDGRWRIARGTMPARVEFDADHPPAGMPAATAVTSKMSDFSGVIDTTLATESRLEFHAADENASSEGAQLGSGMHIDRVTGNLTVSPAVDGRVTLASTSEIDGMRVTSVTGKQATTSETRAGTNSLRITNLSLPDLRAGLHALATLLPLARAQSPGTPPDPALREQLHTLVAALADGATSLSMDQSQDGIVMHGVGPVQGSIAHLGFGMDLATGGDGNLTLALRIQLDQPSFPAIPAGIMTEFLPSHLLLKPRLSGIDAASLRRTLDAAVDDPNPSGAMGLAMAVLDAHPATIGIDDLAIDTGPAHITGHGQLTIVGPGDAEGSGTLRMTGLDAAMQRLSADPQGKQALAGLIFLKGLGRADGDATVWDLAYDGQKLAVNGTDISGMAPGATPK